MNRALIDPVADAVLYEGYILYPYRPSIKNRQRWTLGGLYPEAYARQGGGDAWSQQTECLVSGDPAATIEVAIRFLHLTDRQVGACDPPLREWHEGEGPPSRPVESLKVGDRPYQTWQEAESREVRLDAAPLGTLLAGSIRRPFAFAGGKRSEPLIGPGGLVEGVLDRTQERVEGFVESLATPVGDGLFRLTVRVSNATAVEPGSISRDRALLRSLVSSHAILGVHGGAFVSLMDPPEDCQEAASACRNVGAWPVLVGEEGRCDMMLSSPIILYDYPKIAPESAGDLFDGTEIDEILTLRIMTLTDDEKAAMTAVDPKAGAILARTESLAREQLMGLHGTLRGLRPVPEGGSHG